MRLFWQVWETFGRVREPHYTVRFAGPLPEVHELILEIAVLTQHLHRVLKWTARFSTRRNMLTSF